jgi:hypothetical protein
MLGRVRFADDFFKKERDQLYADWESSFWRELFQNAIDQDVSEVRIGMEQKDNYIQVDFADNGPGMTRQVLEDVYFAIGATTKTGNQIGGMGRARVLTCFAMKSYAIRSQDYLVLGNGGDYEVKDAPFASGCALSIAVDDTTYATLHRKLEMFLSESRIDARVYLNGELLRIKAPLNGRAIRQLVLDGQRFAQVYVNKSARQQLIVRVNGVSMYTTAISAKAQVVVEIDPEVSRRVLTSNRDSLHYEYRRVLDAFLRELAVDTNSALRPRFARHTSVTRGTGLKKVRAKKPPVSRMPEVRDEPIAEERPSGSLLPIDTRDTYEETRLSPVTFARWLGDTLGDIYIFDETDSAIMHKAVTAYLPENWRIRTLDEDRSFRQGGNIIRLLLMWKTAIEYSLEVALPVLDQDEIDYGVGFIFADDRLADHRERDNGHVFCLRPVNRLGKVDYKTSNRRSLRQLMVLAQHEVTHVKERWHDEDFARLRDEIAMRFDEAECLRRMKAALSRIPDLNNDDFSMAEAA